MASPSRLLSLPLEIREQIYTHLLSPASARRVLHDDYIRYRYSLTVFRTNHQIHNEAKAVFHRLNAFVLVETPWEAETHVAHEHRVPIVASGARAAKCKDAVLSIRIDAPQFAESGDGEAVETCKLVLLAGDIGAFARMWFYSDLSYPGLNERLRLTLRLKKGVVKRVQEKLLEPFGMVKGLMETRVLGDWDGDVERALRAAMAVPHSPPETCLEEATKLKDAGNAALQAQRYEEAIQLYEQAFTAMHIVVEGRRRAIWAGPYFEQEIQGGTFAGQYAQMVRLILRVKLVANTLLAYLKLEDWEEVKFWGMRSINLMEDHRGEVAEPMLEFAAAKELGKIYYRTGVAWKMLGDEAEARRLLRIAALYLPNDEIVRKELASVALKIG
ncbi:hypothetical protein H2201_007043 [Coniosporium apollinis]|uniref:F-box domain-containing protein n=1 Tax=Coniosporium apollinis TaxID=61459 RepID=A0ABQ9NK30_9PEZI|nr:hypothetical protein H2201_007043 [Coniosporium apollinis]